VQPVHLFDLAARHAQWASVRQAVITGNIANANSPGFAARDIEPFHDILDSTHLEMARTSAAHIDTAGAELGAGKTGVADSWDVTYSGNSVSIDQELVKADEVSRAFSLDAGIVKAFHRMLLASVRSG
jgi:flagellar basal-body rod protein FlgB